MGFAGVISLSPDGNLIAHESTFGPGAAVLVDVATGEPRRYLHGNPGTALALRFSPDAKMVAGNARNGTVFLWDTDTGKSLPPIPAQVSTAAPEFSPDGSMLATAGQDKSIVLWEIVTRRKRATWKGHQKAVGNLVFAPDGSKLASASADGTVRLWDLRQQVLPAAKSARDVPKSTWNDWWADLAGADASRAYRAIWSFTSAPQPATQYLQSRLKPISHHAPPDVTALIAQMDSNRFRIRTRAQRELAKRGAVVEPYLRQSRARRISLELAMRIDQLLEKLENRELTAEELRTRRAMEVLEKVRTREARLLLGQLAVGAPGAELTRLARLALERSPNEVVE